MIRLGVMRAIRRWAPQGTRVASRSRRPRRAKPPKERKHLPYENEAFTLRLSRLQHEVQP
jgi:hypothetical protein